CPTSKRSGTGISSSCTSEQTGIFQCPRKDSDMYSILIIALISVLAGAVSSQAQQLTTVTATPAEVKPIVTDLPVSGNRVTDVHLRPLFTTTIRLPEAVTSVALGAPTLFE